MYQLTPIGVIAPVMVLCGSCMRMCAVCMVSECICEPGDIVEQSTPMTFYIFMFFTACFNAYLAMH